MTSIQAFCVRWLTAIVVVSGLMSPISRGVAVQSPSCPTPGQQVVMER